ncbi:MAG TPA: hypothetical protein VL947_08060 [Cytophagales bacterium]|nr:hypothetical protein [Cytophagales bacterium]
MEFLKKAISLLVKVFTSFYFAFIICFGLWMLFFDDNDVFSRIRLWNKKKHLEDEVIFYNEKIAEVKKEKEEILGSDKVTEKFAREKYLMKKPTEEIFIIKKKTE